MKLADNLLESKITQKAAELIDLCKNKGVRLTLAESCTGGLISAFITSISGASEVFDAGFITYSNNSKIEILGVKPSTLEAYGAVSAEVIKEMAYGAVLKSQSDISISISGIAGPNGGTAEKPVGLVYIGYCAMPSIIGAEKNNFIGNRYEVRLQATLRALELGINLVNKL